jgi:hypothetical protein
LLGREDGDGVMLKSSIQGIYLFIILKKIKKIKTEQNKIIFK